MLQPMSALDITPSANVFLRLLEHHRRQDIWRACAAQLGGLSAIDSFEELHQVMLDTLRQHRVGVRRAVAAPFVDAVMGRSELKTFAPNGWAISVLDATYPDVLRQIPDPPLVLWGCGDQQALSGFALALVGARQATHRGRALAAQLAQHLAGCGSGVISGLAYGIDAAAHSGALTACGVTVAVLGGGLGRIYPARHLELAQRIVAAQGAVVSEYAPGQSPRPHQFPERNRIVSGLAQGVVVVEAGNKSGSLITARLALEQGREVFAVPGPVDSSVSQGCHHLIQQGAALVTGAEDLCRAMGLEVATPSAAGRRQRSTDNLSPEESRLLQHLSLEPLAVDVLQQQTGIETARLLVLLSDLELKGFVQQRGVGYIAALDSGED